MPEFEVECISKLLDSGDIATLAERAACDIPTSDAPRPARSINSFPILKCANCRIGGINDNIPCDPGISPLFVVSNEKYLRHRIINSCTMIESGQEDGNLVD